MIGVASRHQRFPMRHGVVQVVARIDHACLVGVGATEARVVIAQPRHFPLELVLLTDETDLFAVGDTGVQVGVEACNLW